MFALNKLHSTNRDRRLKFNWIKNVIYNYCMFSCELSKISQKDVVIAICQAKGFG